MFKEEYSINLADPMVAGCDPDQGAASRPAVDLRSPVAIRLIADAFLAPKVRFGRGKAD
jgi:hypothetical protein